MEYISQGALINLNGPSEELLELAITDRDEADGVMESAEKILAELQALNNKVIDAVA